MDAAAEPGEVEEPEFEVVAGDVEAAADTGRVEVVGVVEIDGDAATADAEAAALLDETVVVRAIARIGAAAIAIVKIAIANRESLPIPASTCMCRDHHFEKAWPFGQLLLRFWLRFIFNFDEARRKMESDLAQALAALTTGIYVLTVADGGHYHGMSSSWVTQVSGVPPLFSAAVDNGHFSRAVIARTGVFGMNIVGSRGKELEDYFYSGQARRADNLAELEYELSPALKVPWLKLAMVSIEARVSASIAAGDHTIFVAEPAGMRIAAGDRPLTSLDLEYVYLGGKGVIARDRTGWPE